MNTKLVILPVYDMTLTLHCKLNRHQSRRIIYVKYISWYYFCCKFKIYSISINTLRGLLFSLIITEFLEISKSINTHYYSWYGCRLRDNASQLVLWRNYYIPYLAFQDVVIQLTFLAVWLPKNCHFYVVVGKNWLLHRVICYKL